MSEIRATLSQEYAPRRDFGDGPIQVKRMAMLTGVNPRVIRNWLQSDNGPNGAGLVVLMRHSEQVTCAVLSLADRRKIRRGLRRKACGAIRALHCTRF